MFHNITLLITFLLLLIGGYDRSEALSATTDPEAAKTAASSKKILLNDQVALHRYEVPSQALLEWYAWRSSRPALLLYSNSPLMQATTPTIQNNLIQHLAGKDESALRYDIANPAILPQMTLHTALVGELFSAVYWVMPFDIAITELSIDIFRQQMIQIGALNNEEAQTLTLHEGVFSGEVHGVPFHALHPQAKFAIKGPVVFHFDLSYLSPLYKGEIKTPLYPLIYQTLDKLSNLKVEAVTAGFSYSQISGEVPLGSRFVGEVFAQLFKQPNMLKEKLPAAWVQRANALYLPDLFNVGQARDILMMLSENNPADASLHYALYHASRGSSSTRQGALDHLGEAVRRDPTYALEYLVLAPKAREKGRPDEALRILSLAREANPDNPFIALELVHSMIEMGHGDTGVPILKELLTLDWSTAFYPEMPGYLEQLLSEVDSK
ncbi:MAG: hypothetical protein OES84_04235 [Kiritimatiellaceae bacterium]|nr:hypothetical protein [Kiritimatiellaceae bacterium]